MKTIRLKNVPWVPKQVSGQTFSSYHFPVQENILKAGGQQLVAFKVGAAAWVVLRESISRFSLPTHLWKQACFLVQVLLSKVSFIIWPSLALQKQCTPLPCPELPWENLWGSSKGTLWNLDFWKGSFNSNQRGKTNCPPFVFHCLVCIFYGEELACIGMFWIQILWSVIVG